MDLYEFEASLVTHYVPGQLGQILTQLKGKPEDDFGYLLLLFTILFETKSLIEPIILARLAGPVSPHALPVSAPETLRFHRNSAGAPNFQHGC